MEEEKSEPVKVQTNSHMDSESPRSRNFNAKVEKATSVKITSSNSAFIDDILETLANSYRLVATSNLMFDRQTQEYRVFVNIARYKKCVDCTSWVGKCLREHRNVVASSAACSDFLEKRTGYEEVQP